MIIINALISGILVSGMYALMASGLTLIFGVMEIINLAQGVLIILGAYLSYALERATHIDPFVSLLITMPAMFVIGVGISWGFLRRLKHNREILSILVLYTIALLIEGLLNLVFTTDTVQLSAWYTNATFPFLGLYLPYIDLFAFMLSLFLLALLSILVYRTKFGYGLRAIMQNRVAASQTGINVERISAITFGIGVALAAGGGIAFGATNAFNAASADELTSRFLLIVVLGGMGSLRGAIFGSLFMTIVSNVTTILWSASWSDCLVLIFLIVLLLSRPQGFFGRREGRKQ